MIMRRRQIVIDTNVLIAALRSNRGAAFLLLSLLGSLNRSFEINLSVPLVVEYEDVALRPGMLPALTQPEIEQALDYLCEIGSHHEIFFLWRPFLRDPKDDMVLELAIEAQCDFIVTFNQKDFVGVEQFGLEALTPYQFLQRIGELP